MSEMKCPKCLNEQLVIHYKKGVEIDVCANCGGVWLDRGELLTIIKANRPSYEEIKKVRNLKDLDKVFDFASNKLIDPADLVSRDKSIPYFESLNYPESSTAETVLDDVFDFVDTKESENSEKQNQEKDQASSGFEDSDVFDLGDK